MPSACLVVDQAQHANEIARFWSHVVKGPGDGNCWIWTGAIADDGYGRFWILRDGRQRVVRPNRYVLAVARGSLPADCVSEHCCNVPICVRASAGGDPRDHVVDSTQKLNMERMALLGRGGGPWWRWRWRGTDRATLAARSRALRDAVRDGWDDDRIAQAVASSYPPEQTALW